MRKPIRFQFLLAVAALAVAPAFAQQVGISTNGAVPDPDAMLDINATSLANNAKRGLLIPRMANLPAPAALPDGLFVYRTGGVANRGFWVVDQGQWVRLLAGKQGWDLYGNWLSDGTNPNPDFIGTTDERAMYFRTNNLHRMRMDGGTGHLGVGYPIAAPATADVKRHYGMEQPAA